MQAEYSHLAQQLQAGHPVTAPTHGTSMQPLLYEGQTLVVLLPLSGPLRRGDVALYQRENGMYVLHRIVAVQGDTYITRGDNCFYQEMVQPRQMLGVMTEVLRGEKTIRTTDPGYRCYVRLWMAGYPLRAKWRTLCWRLGRLKQKLHPEDRA